MTAPDRSLSDLMQFDHPIEVHADGSITDAPPGIYAPELYDSTLQTGPASPPWTLLDGFSRQDRYSGPIMHPSEYIGGALETYIRTNPGIYVALVDYPLPDPDDPDDETPEPDGWAIAYIPATDD